MAGPKSTPVAGLVVEDDESPDVWGAAAHATIPDDAWEYHVRKSLNDAAYKGLDYVPYCPTMPLKKDSEDVLFIWKKKGAH